MKHIVEYKTRRCKKGCNIRLCDGFGNEYCGGAYDPCGGEHTRYAEPDVNLCEHYIVTTSAAIIENGVIVIKEKALEDEERAIIVSVQNTPTVIADVDSDSVEINILKVSKKPSRVITDVPQLNNRF